MTDLEFKQEVLGFEGMYPRPELLRFYTYYTTKKHFSTIKSFTLKRRLKTWFDKGRAEKFKQKIKQENANKTKEELKVNYFKNSLGKFNPLL